jgi:hypothetical protein
VAINIIGSLGLLVFLIQVSPFVESTLNTQEVVNEFFILASAYVLIFFTDYVPPDTMLFDNHTLLRNLFGRTQLIMMALFILINMALILSALARKLIADFRAWKMKKWALQLQEAENRRQILKQRRQERLVRRLERERKL